MKDNNDMDEIEFNADVFCESMQSSFDNMNKIDELIEFLDGFNAKCSEDALKYSALVNISTILLMMLDSGYIWQLETSLMGMAKIFFPDIDEMSIDN